MISGAGSRKLFVDEPELKNDPRFKLYPDWIQAQVAAQPTPPIPGFEGGGSGKMVIDAMKAGALVVAGTDGPNAINLHGELLSYTLAGMSNFDALKAATVNPARALAVDTGTIEAGKLADLIVVDGDPLVRMADLHKIKKVVANGRLYELNQLVNAAGVTKTSTQR